MISPTALSRVLPPLALLLATPAVRAQTPGQAPGHAGKAPAAISPAAAQLEKLKSLAGTWSGKASHGDAPAHDATTVFRVTGGGSAVVETLGPGTPHEMVTVYHLDGDQLVLTHYCAAGNQPTMQALPSKDPAVIAFDFVRGSNMKPGDMHMHSARLVLAGEDRLEGEWVSWVGGKPAGSVRFSLTRQK
ncbi:MAG TPA: hypothetical protein VFR85_15880 [Anaeromyxobacteraceae bacterium]|nr:hypothetical protein [Anaeromyxobacteraceae bacterium]